MKLIMAVSKDGYVARKRGDDMSWTGPSDKAAFRLLTCVGGTLACGSKTWDAMPKTLAGRRLIRLSTAPPMSIRLGGDDVGVVQDLDWYSKEHPNGWLIGGQTIALAALALDMVDQAFICQSSRYAFPTEGEGCEKCVLGVDDLKEEYARHNPKWEKSLTIKFGDVDVYVWNRLR